MLQTVNLADAGSNPVIHPKIKYVSLAEWDAAVSKTVVD